jgi:hypothetical protein
MHAVADRRIPLPGLTNATTRQMHDVWWRIEQLLWNANLALGSFINPGHPVGPDLVVTALRRGHCGDLPGPQTHTPLDELRGALTHGEILLMIGTEE